MKNAPLAISALVTLTAVQVSSAAVAVFTNYSVWEGTVTAKGQTVATETFNSIAPGSYELLSGSPLPASGITWTATAPTHGVVANGATLRPDTATEDLVFDFEPGVQGIGGNIYTQAVQTAPSFAFIQVTLADGVSYFGNSNNPQMFIGFYSSSASIAKLTIKVYQVTGAPSYATVDNLYFAVPAPGALALLAAAGLVGVHSRRRG